MSTTHGVGRILVGAVAGAGALYAGRWALFDAFLIYTGAATLLASSIANVILRRRATPASCSGKREIVRSGGGVVPDSTGTAV